MNSLVLEREPLAISIKVSDEWITVALEDGRSLSVPLAWYPRLVHASPEERNHWELWGNGYAIEWPDVDEHISVEGLLAGRRSGECEASINRWLATRLDKRSN
jgi:hypothetical protein